MRVETLHPLRPIEEVWRVAWPAALFLGCGVLVGWFAPRTFDGRLFPVLAAVGGIVFVTLLAVRPTFERVFHLLLLSLPLMTAFVINLGGFIRASFLLVLAGLLAALVEGRLAVVRRNLSVSLLHLFVLFSLVSTVLTLQIPNLRTLTESGIRGLPIRSLIQAGQLLLMVAAFHLTLSYVRTRADLERVVRFILWGAIFASLYGFYELFAALLKVPFLDLNNAALSRGNITAGYTVAGVWLPRPRSTFFEPIGLATFLLFAGPLVAALAFGQRRRARRWGMLFGCVGMAALFVAANSRAALIGSALALGLVLLLVRTWQARIVFLVVLIVVATAFGAVVWLAAEDLWSADLVWVVVAERVGSVATLRGRTDARTAAEEFYAEPRAIFAEHPLLGVGIGNLPFYVLHGGEGAQVATAGSLYVQLLTEGGIVGTGLFLAFVGSVCLSLLRVILGTSDPALHRFALASLTSVIAVLVTWIAVPGLYTDTYLWVMLALAVAIPRLRDRARWAA